MLDTLHTAQKRVSDSRRNVQKSVWNLRTRSHEGQSLYQGLKELLTESGKNGAVSVSLTTIGREGRIPERAREIALRIAQEAVLNALTHANGPLKVSVVLTQRKRQITLEIQDDGPGFDEGSTPKGGAGLGIPIMRERAEKLAGTLTIESDPGIGTRVLLTLPIKRAR